ncbi:hypothetical protein JCM16303_003945 [Sporobolomyces ruberrimus]
MPSSEEDQARRASKEAKKRKRHVWDKIEQTLHNLAQYHENSKTNFDPGRCSVRVLIGQNWGTLRLAILEEVYGAVEKVEKELADGKHEFVRGMRVSTDVPALLPSVTSLLNLIWKEERDRAVDLELSYSAFNMLLQDCCVAAHRAEEMQKMCTRFRADAMLGKRWGEIGIAKQNAIARKLVALEKLAKEGHDWNYLTAEALLNDGVFAPIDRAKWPEPPKNNASERRSKKESQRKQAARSASAGVLPIARPKPSAFRTAKSRPQSACDNVGPEILG